MSCPLCHKDPFKGYDGDKLYDIGAYNVDPPDPIQIECGSCGEKIYMRPFESISHDFAVDKDDL